MKFLSAVLASVAVSYAAAECNNMCSGHGSCGANDMCTCYRNWRGNDCSERTCQYGEAFVDTAQGDLNHDGKVDMSTVNTQWDDAAFEQYGTGFAAGEAHAYMECSNKGLCDRATGECVCFEGYEGSACQRTVCPNACSGHGVCRNIVDITNSLTTVGRSAISGLTAAQKNAAANFNTGAVSTARHSYNLWDGLNNQACVCDYGYDGYSCEKRLCPKNADPLDDGKVYETQTVAITTAAARDGTKSFTLTYTDNYGEAFTTGAILTAATATTVAANIKTALEGIPNGIVQDVVVTCTDDGTNPTTVTSCAVKFANNAGNLNVMTSSVGTGVTSATVTDNTVAGTTILKECSGRGICDYDTGICKCFRGYRTDDCHLQHALAF
jgi:hypothetical protein